MNNNLLLRKRINFPKQNLEFLHFIHPQFEIVDDIDSYDNPFTSGIIYTGVYSDNLISKLNSITNKWIVVNAHHFDLDLSTNDGLIKNLLPLHYIKLKNSKDTDSFVYNISYEALLDKIKISLINNSQLQVDESSDQSVYNLFVSILSTPDVLNNVYFNTVNKNNVSLIISSILTFLNRVQSQNIRGASVNYARLISQSNKRYGKKIKQAVSRFVKSKSNKEIALYNLLTDLNMVR